MLFGQFPVSGSDKVAAKFWSNGKIGRADFQLRNIGNNTVTVSMYESDFKGNVGNKIGDDVEIKAGGISTISFSTAKPVILFKSSSTNVLNSVINLDAQFLGRAFYGQLDVAESLKNKAFDGVNINGTNQGSEVDEGESSSDDKPSKKSLTITVSNKSITYGDDKPEFEVTYSEEVDQSVLSGTLSFNCSYEKGNGAGDYPITASGLESDEYDISYVPGTLSVGKRDLKLKAKPNIQSVEIGYNSITSFDTELVSESGNEFVNSDSLSSLGGTPEYHVYIRQGTYQNPSLGNEITDLEHVVDQNLVATVSGYTSDNYNLIYVLYPFTNYVI